MEKPTFEKLMVAVFILGALALIAASCNLVSKKNPGSGGGANPPPAASWKASPTTLVFNGEIGGQAPAQKSFVLTNTGSGAAYFKMVSDRGWVVATPPEGTLAAGGAAPIAVGVEACAEAGESVAGLRLEGADVKVEVRRKCVGALQNHDPTASLGADPTSGPKPLTVTFTIDTSDADGDPLNCALAFGDGGSSDACAGAVTHEYSAKGNYAARLSVSDGRGGTASSAVQIEVGEPQASAGYITVFAAGDIANDDPYDEKTAQLIQSLAPESGEWYVLALGDLAYEDGKYQEFLDYYDPSWGAFKSRTYPVLGNHEYHTTGASGYFKYWGDRGAGPDGWYAFSLGKWRVYALNTNCSRIDDGCKTGSREYAWFKQDLEDHPSDCSLMFAHQPRYSTGHHGDNAYVDYFWDLFYDHGGELYLSGHDHGYERFKPRDDGDDVDGEKGVRQFVVGSGGLPLYDFDSSSYADKIVAHVYGVVELKLYDNHYTWRFVDVDGQERDGGSANCHAAP